MARRYPQLESEGAHGCRGAPRRALHRRPEVAPGSGDCTAIRMDALPSPLVRGRLARTGPFRVPIGTRGRNARVPARRARRRPREQPRRRRAGTLLTRAPAGATSPAELAALCARDDRLGSLYRSLRELSEEYAQDIRGGVPKLARRVAGVSGYSLAIVEHRPLVGLSTCPRESVSGDCFSAIGLSFPVGSIGRTSAIFQTQTKYWRGPRALGGFLPGDHPF